jgi:hypothetical protein
MWRGAIKNVFLKCIDSTNHIYQGQAHGQVKRPLKDKVELHCVAFIP